jgi:tryptophan 2,3-dioxygenase
MNQAAHWDQYGEYLQTSKILSAQEMQSALAGHPSHDEMLFIQFHQIYELWFKQILFELDDVQQRFAGQTLKESDMQPILTYLGRVVLIFKQMEGMLDVLETMPAQSFVDFREYLGTASGFQSLQFRLVETRLGLRRGQRMCVFHGQYDELLRDESKAALQATESTPSLYDQLEKWLERTPFVNLDGYQFWQEYRKAVETMFAEKIANAPEAEHEALAKGKEKFEGIFDAAKHSEGAWRLSLPALQAALFINLYRHEPVLQAPYQLLVALMDVDELLARWRFRHALMVQRMVGMGMGTGGSSGYEYLMNTVKSHRIYTDLFALASYMIPSRMIPALPEEIRRKMDYTYATHHMKSSLRA